MTFASVDGLPRLVDGLEGTAHELGRLQDLNRQAVELVARDSLARAPRKTGQLATGTTVLADDDTGTLRNDRRYALPVHAGWRRGNAIVAGRPWIAETALRDDQDVADLYQGHVDTQIGKV